jgi:hypothetical protein
VEEAAARDLFKVMRAAHFIFHRSKKVSFKLSSGTLNTPMQIYSLLVVCCALRAPWIYGTCWRSPFRPPLLLRVLLCRARQLKHLFEFFRH